MRTIILFSLLLSSLAYAAIYKSIDKQGNVIFSDVPVPGAKPFPLDVSPPAEPRANTQDSNNVQQQEPKLAFAYKNFQITNPTNNATIRDNNGNVSVGITVEPPLRKGDMIQLYMDNTKIGPPTNSTFFALGNINRGTHTLEAELLVKDGKSLRSQPVIFFMHQAFITPTGIRSMTDQNTTTQNPLQTIVTMVTALNNASPIANHGLPPADTSIKQGDTPDNQQQAAFPDNSHYPQLNQGQTPNGQQQGSLPGHIVF